MDKKVTVHVVVRATEPVTHILAEHGEIHEIIELKRGAHVEEIAAELLPIHEVRSGARGQIHERGFYQNFLAQEEGTGGPCAPPKFVAAETSAVTYVKVLVVAGGERNEGQVWVMYFKLTLVTHGPDPHHEILADIVEVHRHEQVSIVVLLE